MKIVPFFLLVVLGQPLLELSAEDPPARRPRRRIIVYDQQPDMVDFQTTPSQTTEAEEERRRILEREASALGPAARSNTALPNAISLTPIAPVAPPSVLEEEKEEWISVTDLMQEEDLLEMEGEEETGMEAAEMEITEWDNLQRELIREEITGTNPEAEEVQTEVERELQEEMEETSDERRDRAISEDAALELESVLGAAPVGSEPVTGDLEDGLLLQMEDPLRQPALGAVSPVTVVPAGTGSAPEVEFSRSRDMLADLQDRLERSRQEPPASLPGRPANGPASFEPSSGLTLRDPFADRSPVGVSPSLPGAAFAGRVDPVAPAVVGPVPRPGPAPARTGGVLEPPRERIRSQLGAGAGY